MNFIHLNHQDNALTISEPIVLWVNSQFNTYV